MSYAEVTSPWASISTRRRPFPGTTRPRPVGTAPPGLGEGAAPTTGNVRPGCGAAGLAEVPRAFPRGRPLRRVDDPGQLLGDPLVRPPGLAVHPGDGRPGQDVVELVQQHRLPDAVQLLVGVRVPGAYGRRRRPQLGLAQQVLAAAVALLGPGLAGVGGAVQFQVELADPDGRSGYSAAALAKNSAGVSTTPSPRPRGRAGGPPWRPSRGSGRHRRRPSRRGRGSGWRRPCPCSCGPRGPSRCPESSSCRCRPAGSG
ncbi:hypothetical protein SPURM210S_06205 [Streptomyces purpurascens]